MPATRCSARPLRASRRRFVTSICLGRLGGDEFVVFASDASGVEATRIANEIIGALREHPPSFESQSFNVACSVGIAMVPVNNVYTPAELGVAGRLGMPSSQSGWP